MRLLALTIPFLMLITGCSYVSDSIEGAITDRSSFTLNAEYSKIGGHVDLTWEETDSSSNFAGIEIYRTKYPNDEYSEYILVRSRYEDSACNQSGGDPSLGNGYTTNYSDSNLPSLPLYQGIYFYRVAFIHWDEDQEDADYIRNETNYYIHTEIDSISGYGKVVID